MTLHLSRLTLDPAHAGARRDLAAPYELHRSLARAFGDAPDGRHRAHHGVLFRVEDAGPDGVPVLVQSATRPDWSALPDGYAARIDGPKPLDPALAQGRRLRFRLAANPVRRVSVEGKANPRRLPLVHPLPDADADRPDGYLPWLLRQAAAHGFALPTSDGPASPVPHVAHAPFRYGPRAADGRTLDKRRLPLFGVRFDGTLTVTDPDALADALRRGIGPAKAYGFGLLSLAP